MEKISILIADDHKLIRETWSFILNNDTRFMVVAECGDSEQAVEMARTKKSQIYLLPACTSRMAVIISSFEEFLVT